MPRDAIAVKRRKRRLKRPPKLRRAVRPPLRRDQESFRNRKIRPEFGNYRDDMPTPARKPRPPAGQRQAAFGAVVARAIRLAKNRGMTVAMIEEATDVGNSTFYAWQNGQWSKDPRPTQVRDFFEGLGMDVAEAYQALGWSASDKDRKGAAPVVSDPVVQELFDLANRKLNDPNVEALEKALIRRELRKVIAAMKETLDL